jgi:RNA polymerase sigma-70 factor (ECF subfamily)
MPDPTPGAPGAGLDVDLQLGRAWRQHRRHVLDVSFRMLGDLAAAEDVVQEAFARLVDAGGRTGGRAGGGDAIEDAGGWLVVVASRLCLDRLRAQQRHRTTPTATFDGPLGPGAAGGGHDPARRGGGPADPADRVTLDDDVRLALHRMLERLSAAERTTFVLHDVFGYPFEAVADIVGRTPAACRQLASRARRTVRDDTGPPRFAVEPAEQRRLTRRFIAACSGGDLAELLAVLDPAVDGAADVGGRVGVRVTTGAAEVATALLRHLGPDSATTLLTMPVAGGGAGVLAVRGDRLAVAFTLTIRDDRVVHIDGVVDPAKLAPLAAAVGLGR